MIFILSILSNFNIFKSRGARAVFQFYPENQQQCELIFTQATKAGFRGGIVIDNPESQKSKKQFF